MKSLLTRMLTFAVTALLAAGCGGAGGAGSARKAGHSEDVVMIYRTGIERGARDALDGLPSDYTRHLKNSDSPFLTQFQLGYRKGYENFQQ